MKIVEMTGDKVDIAIAKPIEMTETVKAENMVAVAKGKEIENENEITAVVVTFQSDLCEKSHPDNVTIINNNHNSLHP